VKIASAWAGVRRLFLDTSPIIYHVQGIPTYQALMDWVFQQFQARAFELVTSPVTLAECLVQPYRQGDMGLVQQFRIVITGGNQVIYQGIDAVAENAAELRARYNLTLTDAFQVAAALSAGCQALLTNDLALKRVTDLTILVLDELEI
jgi:predicted nucleic acid-binding protein